MFSFGGKDENLWLTMDGILALVNPPIDMLGTSSWTSDIGFAKEHNVDGMRIIFVSDHQSQGTSIMAYSVIPLDWEVIVSKNVLYVPVSIVQEEGTTFVFLKEV